MNSQKNDIMHVEKYVENQTTWNFTLMEQQTQPDEVYKEYSFLQRVNAFQ